MTSVSFVSASRKIHGCDGWVWKWRNSFLIDNKNSTGEPVSEENIQRCDDIIWKQNDRDFCIKDRFESLYYKTVYLFIYLCARKADRVYRWNLKETVCLQMFESEHTFYVTINGIQT